MRYEDLNQYDQELLNTDLGDFEKEASEKLAEANEVYAYGQEQAHAIADQMDYAMAKHAEEEEEDDDEEEEMDEESEKKAAELGAFIERGLFDELTKLGSERHGDPMHYYYPYMEEKIAQIGAEEKLAGWREALTSVAAKGKDLAGKAKEKLKAGYEGAKVRGREAREGFMHEMRGTPGGLGGIAGLKSDMAALAGRPGAASRARALGHLGGKAVAPGLAAGGTAAGMYAYDKSKKKRKK